MIIKKASAFHKEYDRTAKKVAEFLADHIKDKRDATIVDMGCGSGALTIPLAKKLKKYKILAIDNEKTSLKELGKKLKKYKIKNVKVIRSDVKDLKQIKNNSVDYVVSHWLLGVILKKNDVIKILKECSRILKSDGLMVHSESDPRTENVSKELYRKADTFILNTNWWNPLSIKKMALKIGFRNIKVHYKDFKIKLTPEATKELFFDWEKMFSSFVFKEKSSGKAQKFIDKHWNKLKKCGIPKFPLN